MNKSERKSVVGFFGRLSVKKKLLLGFIVSSTFIVGIGALSSISIQKSRDTALVRVELEHQVAIIRNVRMHLSTTFSCLNWKPKMALN